MENNTAAPNAENSGQPEPETLKPRSIETGTAAPETTEALPANPKDGQPVHRRVYRPSHRATFLGLAAVAAILITNAIIIGLVIRGQNNQQNQPTGQVTINQDALNKLGVNQTGVGGSGVQLTIEPNTNFKGNIVVGGDIQAAGQLKLNGTFSASSARFTTLDAGDSALNQLAVSGSSTLANLNVPKSLVVAGTTRLQGAVTVTQLFTVNNSVNISGNVAVGAALSAGSISGGTVAAISNLVIGGHVISSGSVPSVSTGSSTVLGTNGSVSISGNDQAGTVAFNVGTGSSGGGRVASVTFHTTYSNTPHVIVTPIGDVGTFYISRNSSGFSIFVGNALSPGGYAFDYIVEQ
jgi:cytoskeletal protein CcmA (bactofilin family)